MVTFNFDRTSTISKDYQIISTIIEDDLLCYSVLRVYATIIYIILGTFMPIYYKRNQLSPKYMGEPIAVISVRKYMFYE
jgi:energy-converting hydrogenase Eha subunit F